MKLILACTAVVLLLSAVQLARPMKRQKNSISYIYRTANITPVPQQILKVYFGGQEITPGMEIPPEDAIERPTIGFYLDSGCYEYYTFVALNIDYPSADCKLNPILSASLEALYVNAYGTSDIMLEDACEIAAWTGPNPYPCSGLNRYVMYVYKQPGILNTTDEALVRYESIRLGFSLDEFVEAFDLSYPVAGNFFRSRYPLPPGYCID